MEEYQEEPIEQGLIPDSDDQDEVMGYSEPRPVGGLYALFQDVLTSQNSLKVSNVDPKTELGDIGITVRDCLRIALISAMSER